MMIDKRLVGMVPDSKKYIAGNVVLMWCSLVANIVMMSGIALLLQKLFFKTADSRDIVLFAGLVAAVNVARYFLTTGASRMSYLSVRAVKKTLREQIYQKLLKLGMSYREELKTSEIVQVAVEGVEQLETYFGAYLPQFFYAMAAPLTLFIVLLSVSVPAAVLLFVCVPLIPVAIALVQTWAKKLLSRYWDQYTALGDTFLENLQGLTTLKVYQTDGIRHAKMNEESEKFRKITMKVLTMQLNSITIMDIVAYGGAALGIVVALLQYRGGHTGFGGCLLIILLSADFFLPMRQLGSFFHIAMNGMAASGKMFRLLELKEEPQEKKQEIPDTEALIRLDEVCFSYEPGREILHDISMELKPGSFTAIVGESGSGKSTLASVLTGQNKRRKGTLTIGGVDFDDISEESRMRHITYVSHNSYLFGGTVRDNLLMAKPDASEEELWRVLEQTKLSDFLKSEQGLDTVLTAQASNLSGGQRQRLALARALLHDSPVYLFDEATSNIDVESENDIMEQIIALAQKKTVIVISHRLANTVTADRIYVLADGKLAERGTHEKLLEKRGVYASLWNTQQALEHIEKEETA
ncbi:ABC transporter ATP-binding protein/permease [Roseburia sp. BX0805]|uniref:ABC transporter ATP-binding protein/permease n=1 Tax=Roseburia yibonii TaxID=2763063 RepID=A0ABR7I706_9FIRM|nr:ABC transporter ATP-binding protein/permease [Roseburia yibonii]MBC5752699.1 ABC transporter ATP-binding protein/permease [Roseburia yibonii]